MELLKQVVALSANANRQVDAVVDVVEDVYEAAIAKAKEKLNITEAPEGDVDVAAPDVDVTDTGDKGQYGSRQVEFKQDVYRIPETPTGDVSQPIGLLTQSDLNNYVLFKKGDRLTFKWVSGEAGTAKYDAVRNGDVSVDANIEWTDALIRELEDEGALTLMSSK